VEVELSGKLLPAISRPYFLPSLTEVSHTVWRGVPLEMNGETKTGVRVQTASKAEVRSAGFPPAPQIEVEEEETLHHDRFLKMLLQQLLVLGSKNHITVKIWLY
jgi:hypothetical protein